MQYITVLIFLLIYGLEIGVALSSRRNYRRGEEHGSAKWGSAAAVNKKYQAKNPEANKVFTKHVRMGLDGRKHRRNLNTVVVGGSGSGKSRFYALINLLQACSSYFVLDCKGELLRMTGIFLKMRGYEIKVLDLPSMEKSHCFNPFAYLQTDNDVQKLVTNLFKATTPKGSQSNDPFWDTAASMLLSAIIFYLLYEAPEEEQNFPMVMEMLRAGEVREDDDTYQSPLDELFERLEMRNPDHIAVKYYKDYHSGSAKTLKSIQITLAARLEKFNLASVAALTGTDELELASLGEKKVALFALIPDHDVSFNFLVSMVYSCTFEQLFRLADDKYNEKLAEIWTLVTQSPQAFKGGSIWNVMVSIHGAVQAIGLALIVLFFFMGVMKTCGSFADLKRPEVAVKVFVRFALAKAAVTHGLELMNALFSIAQGLVSTIMSAAGFGSVQTAVLPTEIITAVEDCGFFESIPLWAVTLIGGLLVTVLSFVMIMTVYERFFKRAYIADIVRISSRKNKELEVHE